MRTSRAVSPGNTSPGQPAKATTWVCCSGSFSACDVRLQRGGKEVPCTGSTGWCSSFMTEGSM